MTKYFRLTATSITRYSHYIKVPDSFTKNDIWELKGTDHSMFDGGMFTEDKYSSDWEFDDIYEYKEEDWTGGDATEYTTEELNHEWLKTELKKHCYDRAKEICKQNDVFDDLVEGFQKWYYNFALAHDKEYPYIDYANDEVDPQDVDLIHTWWDECCTDYKNYSNDWESPFK